MDITEAEVRMVLPDIKQLLLNITAKMLGVII